MKTKKSQDRKTKVEQVVKMMRDVPAETAWNRLTAELEVMTEPEARMPRFHPLLNAIWRAATNEA